MVIIIEVKQLRQPLQNKTEEKFFIENNFVLDADFEMFLFLNPLASIILQETIHQRCGILFYHILI